MQDIQATVSPLYAVPMLQAQLPGHEALNRELAALFLALEAEGDAHRAPERRDTQVGVYESNFELHQRREPCVERLFSFINQTLHGFIQGINGFGDADMGNIRMDMHSWFHVTRNGGFQSAHNHPNASWSAIYCVDRGDSDDPASGAVRFQDPKNDSLMYRDPANAQLQQPYLLGSTQLTHRDGQMVVFPSYLMHEVFPYRGQRPRIVVALNAWAQWRRMPAR